MLNYVFQAQSFLTCMTTPEGNFETMVSVIRSIDPQNLDPSFRGIEFHGIEGVFDERAQVEVHCNESLGTHLKRLAKRDKNFDALIKELIDQQRPDSSGNIRFNRIFSSVLRKAGKFVIKISFYFVHLLRAFFLNYRDWSNHLYLPGTGRYFAIIHKTF